MGSAMDLKMDLILYRLVMLGGGIRGWGMEVICWQDWDVFVFGGMGDGNRLSIGFSGGMEMSGQSRDGWIYGYPGGELGLGMDFGVSWRLSGSSWVVAWAWQWILGWISNGI